MEKVPLLLGSPLRRRAVALPVSLALAAILLFAAIQLIATLSVLAQRRELALAVFVTSLVLSTIGALVPITILRFLYRRERESAWLYVVALLWGAVIATGLSLPANGAILRSVADWVKQMPSIGELFGPQAPLLLGAPIAGPLVEETFKGLGLLLFFLVLRDEFDGLRDGFIYGALVDIGFNWFEAAMYVAQGYAQFGIVPAGLHLGGRYALFGLAGHALYSGIFGAFLGWSLQTRR
jgi:RsiW-degrading membrane proteinase PrsW (M82 family)